MQKKSFLLGIDLGTSGCTKMTVFDFEGNVIAANTRTYRYIYPGKPDMLSRTPMNGGKWLVRGHTIYTAA